ncbi:alpha/beta hydrolase fold domain-containing protein [Planomonospora sp. ID91781]|uniref:alpha/beta hydrolase family protein n=1 Tax=Planomonospora sp. ID91781 TaxID=2738135 RepID=UPI0018C3F881|nr:alpha/beta fold hydrolase [Planomonospora sp. ID91781]MBG0824096.1 alpha/beta hydrolase fold domain-containing protein [Planomonospora sp. ID91781]
MTPPVTDAADVDVRVLAGPGLVADLRLLAEVADREFAALGVRGSVAALPGAAELEAAVLESSGPLVVLPGPDPEARALIARHPRAVWLDLHRVAEPAGPGHLHGRGVWGLAWAIRHAVHRLLRPARRVAYGAHPDQWAEVRRPHGSPDESWDGPRGDRQGGPGGDRWSGSGDDPKGGRREPVPVAVVLHGGYWRSVWGADLMDALCADLAGRGLETWNLEYRRPDRHGWAATTADVAAGLALAAEGARGPVVVIGHSAGGQLALRAAADDGRVALAVSLAGVLDLVEGDRRRLSGGAVAAALGGPADEEPEVYARSSPLERLPLKVPQLVVQGDGDDLDLVDLGRRYARAARAAGDDVTYLEAAGDHFDVIDPASPIWRTTAEMIADRVLRGPEGPPGGR